MKNIINHSGNLGDILLSMHFTVELLEAINTKVSDYIFNIQINQPAQYSGTHPYGNVMMTLNSAKFLKPLLLNMGFKDVTFEEKLDPEWINLSVFRNLRLNLTASDLRSLYYELSKFHLPQNFSRNLFTFVKAPNNELKDRIIFIHTSRYNNCFLNLKALERYKDILLFMGIKEEYEQFKKEFFNMQYLPVTDALDAAQKMKSAKGIIGNQSGLYSLAEMLKVNRILLTAEFNMIQNRLCIGPCNVNPQGGWIETVRTQQKLIPAMENLINK